MGCVSFAANSSRHEPAQIGSPGVTFRSHTRASTCSPRSDARSCTFVAAMPWGESVTVVDRSRGIVTNGRGRSVIELSLELPAGSTADRPSDFATGGASDATTVTRRTPCSMSRSIARSNARSDATCASICLGKPVAADAGSILIRINPFHAAPSLDSIRSIARALVRLALPSSQVGSSEHVIATLSEGNFGSGIARRLPLGVTCIVTRSTLDVPRPMSSRHTPGQPRFGRCSVASHEAEPGSFANESFLSE